MTPDNQIKWAEALESDNYQQYCGHWIAPEGEVGCCCLVVYALDVLQMDLSAPRDALWERLSNELQDREGIDVKRYENFNDNHGLSFKEIAQEVRAGEGLIIKELSDDA